MSEPRMEVLVHDSVSTVTVEVEALPTIVEVETPTTQVTVVEDHAHFDVQVVEERVITVQEVTAFDVQVLEEVVSVVSVGLIGPEGPVGPQGLPGVAGGIATAEAPLQLNTITGAVQIAPGTVNGQGLIWNGSAWAVTPVMPTGVGALPFRAVNGFTGDAANLRYEPTEQALYVTRITNTSLDGGNF